MTAQTKTRKQRAASGGTGTVAKKQHVDQHRKLMLRRRILELAGRDAPLRSFRFWKWRSYYLFYTRRLMPNMSSMEDLEQFLSAPEQVYVLIREHERRDLTEDLQSPFHPLETGHVGAKTVHLYSNRPD